MDSKQETLVYLMEEAQALAAVCAKQLARPDKTHVVLEQQLGKLMSAVKETILNFEIDSDRLEYSAEQEWEKRKSK